MMTKVFMVSPIALMENILLLYAQIVILTYFVQKLENCCKQYMDIQK